MKRLRAASLSLLLVAWTASAQDGSGQICPQWAEWQGWSPCIWGSFETGRRDLFVAAGFLLDELPGLPNAVTDAEQQPMCGHCVDTIRVRKRHMQQGCRAVEVQSAPCGEHGDVCSWSPSDAFFADRALDKLGCAAVYLVQVSLRQCSSQTSCADWQRELNNALWDAVSSANCIELGGKCQCCCGEYAPSADGARCELAPMAEERCSEWSEYTDWSDKCMWFNAPPDDMLTSIGQHCDVDLAGIDDPIIAALTKVPSVDELPDRCGYCSFRVKCRSRSAQSQSGRPLCFPLDVEKAACGDERCRSCGAPCTLPKVMGSCQYADMILNVAPEHMRRIEALPPTMKQPLVKLLTNLPFGKCIEKAGRCQCCCHPYEPSSDGLSCRLVDVCKWPDMQPADALNLPPKSEL